MFARQHNSIRDQGALALVHMLNVWTAIRQLDLELCQIGGTGAKALFAAVEASPALHRDPAARRAE
jgi:Ran GTPase-activating protein (RanGAP) involved in mRNA processing and transport